ncbi:MAG: histidine phosphatase family protein [Marinilabiliales bacterium]|nr:histidine phosphatase family protein [Marinilabiliales bacterium]
MKRVILVRHAKSIQYGYDQDFDRTLTDNGAEDALRISQELVRTGYLPDLIISSPAVRTTQTTKIYADHIGYPVDQVRYEKKLYSGMHASTFLRMLHELEDRFSSVMVTGHNPAIYYFLDLLLPEFYLDVPTCSTVVVEFEIDSWADLTEQTGKMAARWIPDLL